MIKKLSRYLIIPSIIISVIIIFIFWRRDIKKDFQPNIILIIVDALRRDHLGCYGYERNTSPNIDKLAQEGLRFTLAVAPGGWTVESVPSILTGTYSTVHQIHDFRHLLNPRITSIAQDLAVRGYQCVIWSNHHSLRCLDIRRGFGHIYLPSVDRNKNLFLTDYLLTSHIIRRLKTQYKSSPFFFYIHYAGCHVPYRPPSPYKHMYLGDTLRKEPFFIPISKDNIKNKKYNGDGKIPYIVAEGDISDPNYYISQYDGALSYTDMQIGRLIDAIKELRLDKNTLIILTADHGEMLGEHNMYFNHSGGYEENILVPLIIRFPGLFPNAKVFSKQVSLVDIAPTLLELLGIKKPSYMQGESLLAFLKPMRSYRAKQAFSYSQNAFTLRVKGWKLIYRSKEDYELYDLKKDPKEEHDLADRNPHKVRELKDILDAGNKWTADSSQVRNGPALTQENKESLRNLGYTQ